jgi:hypothetical protein
MPDGRFIGLYAPAQSTGAAGTSPTQQEIHIVLNWFEELKRLVPVKYGRREQAEPDLDAHQRVLAMSLFCS